MRATLALVALVALCGCGVRETRERVITVDGQEFLCSYTHNNFSGNESEQVCIPFEAAP